MPAGFTTPGGGLNLCVTDGSGTALSYTDLGGGLFSSGIELVDPAGGALASAYDGTDTLVTDGSNIAIITFDLQVDNGVTPEEVLTNTDVLVNYAGVEGGTDYSTENPTDSNDTTIASPVMEKDVLATNQSQTSGTDVRHRPRRLPILLRSPCRRAARPTRLSTRPFPKGPPSRIV